MLSGTCLFVLVDSSMSMISLDGSRSLVKIVSKGFESILADLITLSFSKSPCQDPAGFSTLVHLNDSMFGYIGRFQLGGQFTQVLFF